MKIVLQKYLSEAGFSSRRQAEKFISEGRVKVNGKIAHLGERADENDEVTVAGKRVEVKNKKIYVLLNKPVGYTCTNRSFKGEKNVFDLVNIKERLFVVGRLDKNSHGLVLLTNDGALAQEMTHPRYEMPKVYRVTVASEEEIEEGQSDMVARRFKSGVDIGEDDGIAKAQDVKYLGNNTFKVTLTQGKKRQLRRMFAILGYNVVDLERVALGKYLLGDLKEGKWAEVNKLI
jgi:pseudouridine synthase